MSHHNPAIILKLDGLKKSYGKRTVLDGVSFTLSAGECIGVIGPSGAGKSTLLKMIDILDGFTAGNINYFDSIHVSVSDGTATVSERNERSPDHAETFRKIRQSIGFVFQNLNLWEDRTVIENLILAPTIILKEHHQSAYDRASELCRKFSIEDKIDSRVWQLSGGQKQRVAIIRALMMRPRLMLLDEITSALDPGLVVDVMGAIRTLRNEGIAFILVTHHIEFAYSICHRIVFLEDGKLVQIGTPQELNAPTADPRVKKFCELIRAIS
jgi:ABC-type polar amino acid transport system ATPase subunit